MFWVSRLASHWQQASARLNGEAAERLMVRAASLGTVEARSPSTGKVFFTTDTESPQLFPQLHFRTRRCLQVALGDSCRDLWILRLAARQLWRTAECRSGTSLDHGNLGHFGSSVRNFFATVCPPSAGWIDPNKGRWHSELAKRLLAGWLPAWSPGWDP